MRFLASLFLVALTGFISLSYEIIWVRTYSFVTAGRPRAFGILLGAYLLGLALGSLWSLRHQNERDPHDSRHLSAVAGFVLAANLAGFLLVPAVSFAVTVVPWPATLPGVVLAAALLGAALPLLCHFAIPPDARAGQRLGYLYLSNILGSGAGSLLTGFVLLDHFPLRTISVFLAVLGIVAALLIRLVADPRPRARPVRIAVAAGLAVAVWLLAAPLFSGLWERLQLKSDYHRGERFTDVIQDRYGVITVDRDGVVYGGGVYDGRLSTELRPGSWLVRPYFLPAVHPGPKRVLVIGVSGGSWTQILAHEPGVEHVTAVEINPGYLKLIGRYEAVKSLLRDPKVEIHFDDGRRWLIRHPDARFDAVVINDTYHWREHSTHLLSREFQSLVRAHLNPGGVYLFNATGSKDAAKTALDVFPHAMMVLNNVLASDRPIVVDRERWRRALSEWRIDGRPVLDLTTGAGRDQLAGVLSLVDTLGRDKPDDPYRLRNEEQMRREVAGAGIVTDDNMLVEF